MNWYCRSQTESGIDLSGLEFVPDGQSLRSFVTVRVSVPALDGLWQRDGEFYIGRGGTGQIRDRYERFGRFLRENPGVKIGMPMVSITEDGKAVFTNGRHRFAYLRDLGLAEMPVSLGRESVQRAREFGITV